MNRIRELREERRMNQVRLSVEIGVSQETISAYEIGKHYPSVESLIKMSRLFSASFDYILGFSDIRLPQQENCLQNDEMKALALYRSLDTIQRNKATSYMQGMLDD